MRVSRCEPDSEKEARRLVGAYADMILRISYTYLGSTADAEYICQEVLLRSLTKAPSFESPEHERRFPAAGGDPQL